MRNGKDLVKALVLTSLVSVLAACSSGGGGGAGSSSADGGSDGGGGKGVLCGENLRVLDLYEADEVRGFTAEKFNSASEDETFRFYILKTDRHMQAADPTGYEDAVLKPLLPELKKFRDNFSFIPRGARLTVSQDATLPKIKAGCEVVQIALLGLDAAKVDREYWDMLDNRNRAALFVHELAYNYVRKESKARTSDDIREMVGAIFSTNVEPLLKPTWDSPQKLECNGGGFDGMKYSQLHVVQEIRGGLTGLAFYGYELNGVPLTYSTNAFVPGYSFRDLYGKISFTASMKDESGTEWSLKFENNGLFEKAGTDQEHLIPGSYDGAPDFLNMKVWRKGESEPAQISTGICLLTKPSVSIIEVE